MEQNTSDASLRKNEILKKFLFDHGISSPEFEHRFHKSRRWRIDIAWPGKLLALEVQGGIFTQGRHVRGGALLKEWEKLNSLAEHGWRVIYCQPSDLMTQKTLDTIKACLMETRSCK